MLDRLAEPGLAFAGGRLRQLAREALAQLDVSLDVAAPSTAASLAESSKFCWPARCRTTAAYPR